MKVSQHLPIFGFLAVAVAAITPSVQSEVQTTGTPGSPSAATTIDGKQLPAPDPKFGGVIKDTALQSKPWWAPRVVPPEGAPNILLIMTVQYFPVHPRNSGQEWNVQVQVTPVIPKLIKGALFQ